MLNNLSETLTLLKKDVTLEWRNRYAFNGLALYLVSTIFICYLSFNLKQNQLNPITWNVLFWVIMLFTILNAASKSFMQEGQARTLYYYTIASPRSVIFSKIIYNTILGLLLSFIGFVFYCFVMGNPVQDIYLFLLNIFLASCGFSSSLTMISNIAAKANNNTTLMAILSFPVIIPMLLVVIKISQNALDGLDWSASDSFLLVLIAINLIVIGLSYILFPYLWRS
ncbi:MAG: heme exporter protein CcmB [Bacteroidota bacterium]